MTRETPPFQAHCEYVLSKLPELSQNVIKTSVDALKSPSPDLATAHGRQFVMALAYKLQPLQARFHETLLQRLLQEIEQARIGPSQEPERKTTATRLDELSLVDDTTAQSHIELARTVQEIGLATEWSLKELQAYTAALRGESTIRAENNPFGPSVFARALSDANTALDLPPHERAIIMRISGQQMAKALNGLYQAANQKLSLAGITPVEYNTVVNLHAPAAPILDMSRPGALDKLLQQLPTDSALSAPEVAAALDQALNPANIRVHEAHANHGTPPQRIRALNQLWERMVRESGSVPFVQPLVRSLQTAMLKLAVREPDVADDLQHPSWQFINNLVSYVSGFRPEELNEQRSFVEQISPVVKQLSTHPAPTSADFERAAYQVQTAFETQTAHLLESRAAALKALEEADHLETLKGLLQHQVDQHLEGRTMPLIASDFLRGPWVDVMVHLITHDHFTEEESMSLLNVVEDLVTSLQRPTTMQERDRLRDLLPSLTERLRKGMALINWPPKSRGDLMEQLMVVHARYLRATPSPQPTQTNPDELTAHEIVSRMRSEHIDSVWAQHNPAPEPQVQLDALPTVPMGFENEFLDHQKSAQHAKQWASLIRPGTWFKLSMEGEWVNARLMWVSKNQKFFIFTGKQASDIHTLPVHVLMEMRQQGLITELPQHTLVQKAADSLWSDIDA